MAEGTRSTRSGAGGVIGPYADTSRWVDDDRPVEARGGVRTYRRPVSLLWWARKPAYLLFVLREVSCVFVAWFVAFTTLFAWSVARGPGEYERFLEFAANPLVVAVNLVALAFLMLHTVTWFNLTPQAMPLRFPKAVPGGLGGGRVPPFAVVAAQWMGFVVVSAFVIWLVVA